MLWPRIAPFSLQERLRRAGISGGGGGSGASVLFKYVAGQSIANLGGTFTRTGVATYIDQQGLVQTVATGIPRITWINNQPALYLEGARTNSIIQSQDLSNASWTKTASTIGTGNSDPAGGTTACKVQEDNMNATHLITQNMAGTTDNTAQTITFFAKAQERSIVAIETRTKANAFQDSWINLTTGAVGTKNANHTITTQAFPNSWWKITVVMASIGSGATTPYILLCPSTTDGTLAYLGTTGNGILVWGIQWEIDKNFASSYIPTTTVAVTRNADALSFPFLPVPQALTMYADFYEEGTNLLLSAGHVLNIANSAGNNPELQLYNGNNPGYQFTNRQVAGAVGKAASPSTTTIGQEVELRGVLFGDGSTQIGQSLDAGTEVVSTISAAQALVGNWSGQTLWVGGQGGGANIGYAAFRSVKILSGIASLNQCRSA